MAVPPGTPKASRKAIPVVGTVGENGRIDSGGFDISNLPSFPIYPIQRKEENKLSELQIFANELFEVEAKEVDGEILFNAEHVAKNLGFTVKTKKDGKTYENVRWSRVNDFLPLVAELKQGSFISEPMVYKLAFKASNETAEKFTDWLAIDVIPQIRKTGQYQKPMTSTELLALQTKVLIENSEKIKAVDDDLQSFKEDMPLLAVECDKITTAVRKVGVEWLGGKESNAYNDSSLRSKVYSDIHREVKRNFGVTTYKAIKRNQTVEVLTVISTYKPPIVLREQISDVNKQMKLAV